MQNIITSKILELSDIKVMRPNFDILKIINKETAQKAQVIAFDNDKRKLCILTTNNNPSLITKVVDKIKSKGFDVDFYYVDLDGFILALKWYDDLDKQIELQKQFSDTKRDAIGKDALEMIKRLYEDKDKYGEGEFINELIRLAFQAGGSDLHFQSEEKSVVMRVRKDGVLKKVLEFEYREFRKYLTKLKFMSDVKLNIDYIPQDGRFSFNTNINGVSKSIDVRVSFMPGLIGENIVMRFLDSSKGIVTFGEIGFMDQSLDILKKVLTKKDGLIFVTGPTGSGKTTTLYSILNFLNDSGKKIITLEDPVEYQMPGIQQSQINHNKGYNYEDGLKAILRQDPDIIMVGEIRNYETANIAINAALTGHLVLSTLHTNTAIEAISRLLNMGVAPFMLAPAINLIIGQRLLRKLDDCHSVQMASMAEKADIEQTLKKIKDANPYIKTQFEGKLPITGGCENCGNDGYRGRIAAIETFEVNDEIRNLILNGKSTMDVYASARQSGFITMKEDAYLKMLKGITTLDEIRRVLN